MRRQPRYCECTYAPFLFPLSLICCLGALLFVGAKVTYPPDQLISNWPPGPRLRARMHKRGLRCRES
jgi:hypothetical protein